MKRIAEILIHFGLFIFFAGVLAVIWNASLPDGFGQTFIIGYLLGLLIGFVAVVAGMVLELVAEKS